MLRSLQSRMQFFVIALLTLTVLVLGGLFYRQLHQLLLHDIENEARSASTGYAFAISEWLEIRSSMVKSLRPLVGEPDAAAEFARSAEAGGFDLVYAGTEEKTTLFSKPSELPPGYDPTQRPWYQGAAQAGEKGVFVTKPYVDAVTGQLIISIAAAARKDGKLRGVVANDMTITQIAKEILGVRLPGEGYAYILHKDGTILVHPNKEAILKPASSLAAELTPERVAQAVQEARLFTLSRQGEERLTYLAPIRNSDWVLGVSMSKKAVLAPLDQLLLTLVGVLLAVVVVAALLAGAVTRQMLAGLRQVRDRMQDIAKGGSDLTVRLRIDSRDEIGETAQAFNRFLEQTGQMFTALRNEANQLADGVQRLNGAIDTIAGESMHLSETAGSNAASIEQITVAVSHIADNARDVDGMMRETANLSRRSVGEVGAASAEAEHSVRQVETMAQILHSLDVRSQEIQGIVNVIKGIADQTNLLALNAAIEAARAGEQGRGFAVVADEVRKLAEGTAKATVEIAGMIDAIRGETSSAGQTMEETVATVRRGVEISRDAASRIGDIEQKINEAVSRVGDIALATDEQRDATTAMAQSTEDINNRVMSEDDAIQSARHELGQLAKTAEQTRQLLARFKL
ncbi:MAG: methyl-accepting chemotaxis protein [Azonexus sp.]|nr:methyl-accepting chemotaxis protein [Azonexus sp.]MCK6413744.1 methyl-accepting chemotaxis protein [Azonexus sp.]